MTFTPCRHAEDPEKPCEFSTICGENRQRLAQDPKWGGPVRGMDCTHYQLIVRNLAYDIPEEPREDAA